MRVGTVWSCHTKRGTASMHRRCRDSSLGGSSVQAAGALVDALSVLLWLEASAARVDVDCRFTSSETQMLVGEEGALEAAACKDVYHLAEVELSLDCADSTVENAVDHCHFRAVEHMIRLHADSADRSIRVGSCKRYIVGATLLGSN